MWVDLTLRRRERQRHTMRYNPTLPRLQAAAVGGARSLRTRAQVAKTSLGKIRAPRILQIRWSVVHYGLQA